MRPCSWSWLKLTQRKTRFIHSCLLNLVSCYLWLWQLIFLCESILVLQCVVLACTIQFIKKLFIKMSIHCARIKCLIFLKYPCCTFLLLSTMYVIISFLNGFPIFLTVWQMRNHGKTGRHMATLMAQEVMTSLTCSFIDWLFSVP